MRKFKVSGMTCGHCVASVTNAVRSIDPEIAVAVDLQRGEVTVSDEADIGAVQPAIAAAGYAAIPASISAGALSSESAPVAKSSCCCR